MTRKSCHSCSRSAIIWLSQSWRLLNRLLQMNCAFSFLPFFMLRGQSRGDQKTCLVKLFLTLALTIIPTARPVSCLQQRRRFIVLLRSGQSLNNEFTGSAANAMTTKPANSDNPFLLHEKIEIFRCMYRTRVVLRV